METDFHGVIVYEIIETSGKLVLNGIYANNGEGTTPHDVRYIINNEIAKKNADDFERDMLVGEYGCRYIDSDLVNCILTINIENEVYLMKWLNEKDIADELFTGIGLRVGNHLSVAYVKGSGKKK
jgi:hypothetical protein